MINNRKILEATCIKDYKETMLDGSKKNSNEEIHTIEKTLFNKGDEVYYRIGDDKYYDGYYISYKKSYLYKVDYYDTKIVEMDNDELFNEHFEKKNNMII